MGDIARPVRARWFPPGREREAGEAAILGCMRWPRRRRDRALLETRTPDRYPIGSFEWVDGFLYEITRIRRKREQRSVRVVYGRIVPPRRPTEPAP